MLRLLVKWIKQIFQRIFTQDSQDTIGSESTHTQNLPELTNADLEFLFTQLLEGVYQARGQQWAIRYLQRMENRISEQRWLEWLQIFGSRVLNSPVPNDELAFRMVQLGELNIGIVGEYAGSIGMQLLARTTNPTEWETPDIFQPSVADNGEQSGEGVANFSPKQNHGVDNSDYVSIPISQGREIAVPHLGLPSNNILFDADFQPAENHGYDWEINPDENALIALENTPGQDLLRQFGDELWEVGVEDEPEVGGSRVLPEETNAQVKPVQMDGDGVQFVEFVNPSWDSSGLAESLEASENNFETNLENRFETDSVSEVDPLLNQSSPSPVMEPIGDDRSTGENDIFVDVTEELEKADGELIFPRETELDALDTGLEQEWEVRSQEEEQPEQEYQIIADDHSLQEWVAPPSSEEEYNRDEVEADESEMIAEANPEDRNTQVNTGFQQIIGTPDQTQNSIWPQEWTGVQPDVTVTLEELWVRLQQSTNLVEQLAAGLLNPSATPELFDGSPISIEEQAQALFYQALQQSKSGDLDGAIASYDQALQLQPEAYEYWFNRGLALFYRGDLMAALASYEEAIAIKPDYYKAWLNRGAILGELEQFESAINCFDQAIAIKSDESEAWSSRGTALLKLGRLAEAVQSYDFATQLEPDDGQTWFYRGVALANLGEYADAIASFDEALETEGDYYLIWHQRGIAQVNLHQWEEAISSYDKALELAPHDPDIWISRGYALDCNQNYDAAIASYTQALTINPQLDHIWIDRGVLEAKLGYWQAAIQSWEQALVISPHLYLARFNQAIAWDNLGNPEQALVCYNQAVEIEPNFAVGWYSRGLLLAKQQQWEAAILSYDLAIQIQPDYWEAWLARASAVFSSPSYDTYFTSYSSLANTNPSLNLRGYDGQITTYTEALKYLSPETHPEGWGKINLALGNTYCDRVTSPYGYGSSSYHNPRQDWYHAFDAYNQARITLTPEAFPEQHLEVLQNLIKIYVAFEQTADANALYEHARSFFAELLTDSQRSDGEKRRLGLKFAGIGQLGVDIAVQSGELVQALEIGEYFKNACLHWLLTGWSDQILTPDYAAIQNLVNPTTAIIYWHMSPVAMHTFIIKHLHPEPIPVFTPMLNLEEYEETPLPEAVERLLKFQAWLDEWQQKYREYLSLTPAAQQEHTWRVDMGWRLLELKKILSINNILQELEGISQLILIPHRELFSLPLHALFTLSSDTEAAETSKQLQITYLPTAQSALAQSKTTPGQQSFPTMLSVESYKQLDEITGKFIRTETEIISQLSQGDRILVENASPESFNQVLNRNYDILNLNAVSSPYPQNNQPPSIRISHTHTLQIHEISHQYQLVTLNSQHSSPPPSPVNSEYAEIAIALYHQGIPHIHTNLWEVEATTHIFMMVEFYRRLYRGKSPTVAFNETINWFQELTPAQVQQWYDNLFNQSLPAHITTYLYQTKQNHPQTKLYNNPFHWAGFKIIGGF